MRRNRRRLTLVAVIVGMVVEVGCDIAGTTCEVNIVGVGKGAGVTAAITRVILVAAIVVIVGCGVGGGGILVTILVLAIILLVVLLVLLLHILSVGKFVVLLPLHPPILEPDLDLPLTQAQGVGDFDPSPPS